MTARPKKKAVLKARCDDALKEQVEQLAHTNQLDSSDIVRIAVVNYLQQIRAAASPGAIHG
jgi:antitoxin component of RelBE/YafQ-DinJ toxin-antitoxin module